MPWRTASAPRSRPAGRARRTPRRPRPAPASRPGPAGSRAGAGRARRRARPAHREREFSTKRRSATSRRQVGRLAEQPDGHLGHRERVRAARRRASEDELLDTVGVRDRELLRDHAAEARADDVRPLEPGRVEHRNGVLRELRDGVRPRRHVALTDAAVVERRPRKSLASGSASGSQPQRRSPAPGSTAAARRRRAPRTRCDVMSPPRAPAARRRATTGPRLGRRRARAASPAIPPGRKNTMRMKSTPSTNSGSDRGVLRKPGSPAPRPTTRAPAAAGRRTCRRCRRSGRPSAFRAAEHDHHEQRQREVRACHLGRRAADDQHVHDAAGSRQEGRQDEGAELVRYGRSPSTCTRSSFSRIACHTRPGRGVDRPPHDAKTTTA